ncbi:MAG: hypothetical protein ACOCVZ_06415 [Gemmatimonadota bacterium]
MTETCRRAYRGVLSGLAAVLLALPAGCGGHDRGLSDAELTAMIDSLLPAIAEASGLEVRRPVRFAMQSRAEARAFIERQLDEQFGHEELGGMTGAYRAFGLIPDTLDLRALMLELLTEQVVGYYDPATDRLYVLDEAPAELAAPVVAHELVHALQDQRTDLDSLVAEERGNDRQMAAQAAAEGQAMLVMLALQAAELSGEPLDPGALPDLGPMMRPVLEAENAQFPVFQRAPRLIRETLVFPYIGGATFLQALFRRRGADGEIPVPFGDLLPQSTEQVLEPRRAFLDGRDIPTELELDDPGDGWSVIYENTLGMLETSILLSERIPSGAAGGAAGEAGAAGTAPATEESSSASGWDGDRYALVEDPGGGDALVWYSVWDDAAAADRVADALRKGPGGWAIERMEVDDRPVVRVVVGSIPAEAIPAVRSLEEVATR